MGKATIEGYAAMFEKLSQNLGGFVEDIKDSAFNKTVKESDVRAVFNHDENYVLGRNKSGTLDLSVDKSGLYYRIIPPDTSYAHDLLAVMERGDVNQSSFAFYTMKDDWGMTEQDFPKRSLIEVSLVDVSPVTYPAYLDTTSGIGGIDRGAALSGLAARSGCKVEDLSDLDAIVKALTDEERKEPDEIHSEPMPNRWSRRAQFMRDLERLLDE
jgi:HK97 family phage prohead protease